MPSSRLFELLAEAGAKPSGAFQDASAALGAVDQATKSYSDYKTNERKRTKLSDILGDSQYGDLTLGDVTEKPELIKLFSDKENKTSPWRVIPGMTTKEGKPIQENKFTGEVRPIDIPVSGKPGKMQQAPFLYNGKLMRFDPTTGQYEEAPVASSSGSTTDGVEGGITPRVPPAIPAGEVTKGSGLNDLLADVGVVRSTKRDEFVGPVNSIVTAGKQLTGIGATPDAAIFKSTVAGLRNKVLNLLSGAAISPDEARRLMQQLPSEGRSNVDFNAILGNFERELQLQIANRQKGFSEAGYRTPQKPVVGNGSMTGDPEADAAIQTVMAADIPEPQKQARITAIKARAAGGQPR